MREICSKLMLKYALHLDEWADDHEGLYPTKLEQLVPHYIPGPLPVCPLHGSYTPGYTVAPDGKSFTLKCVCLVDGRPRLHKCHIWHDSSDEKIPVKTSP